MERLFENVGGNRFVLKETAQSFYGGSVLVMKWDGYLAFAANDNKITAMGKTAQEAADNLTKKMMRQGKK